MLSVNVISTFSCAKEAAKTDMTHDFVIDVHSTDVANEIEKRDASLTVKDSQ